MMYSIRRNLLLFGAFNFLAGFRLYAVFLVIYLTKVTGSMTLGMTVFSASILSSVILELPTGILSDAIGRKKTIILGTISALAGIFLYAIGQNVAVLLSGSVFTGLSEALFSGNNDAYLFDLLKEGNRETEFKTYLGKTRSVAHLALCVSSACSGILLYFSSYSLIIWLSVLPKALCTIAALFLAEPARAGQTEKVNPLRHLRETLDAVLKNKRLVKLVAADGLSGGASEAAYQFRVVFLNMVWPVWAIGFAGMLGDACASLSFWISGRWIQRKGHKRIIILGKLYCLIINVVSFLMKNVWSPVLLTTTALFYGATSVAQEDLAQNLYTERHRASMGSLKSLIESLIYSILAVLIGIVADKFGVAAALVSFQAFGLISIFVYGSILGKNAKQDGVGI